MKTLLGVTVFILILSGLAPHRYDISQKIGGLTGSETAAAAVDYSLGIFTELDFGRATRSAQWGETPNWGASMIALSQIEVVRATNSLSRSKAPCFGCDNTR